MKNSNKPNWPPVKFGDVVKNANLTEKNPEAAGIERIVGLEHIDPENLHITRWNSPETGTSFSRKFIPGQTLFGKRRAYQRKVAFAEFEGICSGDILTFESKDPKVLLPALLPFICQTEAFFDYALGTSAGSLSPRTSWKALKDFEFPLPPIDEQKHIAEILWAADEAVDKISTLKDKIENLLATQLTYYFPLKKRSLHVEPGEKRLQDYCHEKICYGIVQAGDHIENGVPYIRVTDMTNEILTIENILRTSPKIATKFKRSTVEEGDIILALRGDIGLVRIIPKHLSGANLTQGTARIAVKNDTSRDYLLWALRSKRVSRQINIVAKGSTFREITLESLRKILIPENKLQQQKIATTLNRTDDKRIKTLAHLNHMTNLYKQTINSLL